MKAFLLLKIKFLAWLLYRANQTRNKHMYPLKTHIIKKYGWMDGYDIQFIEGKRCDSCHGTGKHERYSNYPPYNVYRVDDCWHCYGGWFKRPRWVFLERWRLVDHPYVFHQPGPVVYDKPDIPVKFTGYFPSKHSTANKRALFWLFQLYDFKGYWKRWFADAGRGWRVCYWLPKNWPHNLMHFYRYGLDAMPIKHPHLLVPDSWRPKKKNKQPTPDYTQILEDWPF